MITIISGTNRTNSNSLLLANYYRGICERQEVQAQVLDLADLPPDFLFTASYGKINPDFDAVVERYIAPVSKFVIIVPEYNGSFPGVLKSFLDCISPKLFHAKKSALVGLSAGKAGNLRGMDDLTGILHYLKVEVLSAKPKLSQFETLADFDSGAIRDEDAQNLLKHHLQRFLQF